MCVQVPGPGRGASEEEPLKRLTFPTALTALTVLIYSWCLCSTQLVSPPHSTHSKFQQLAAAQVTIKSGPGRALMEVALACHFR